MTNEGNMIDIQEDKNENEGIMKIGGNMNNEGGQECF